MSAKTSIGCHFKSRFLSLLFVLAVSFWAGSSFAQQKYEKPPQEVLDVLNAPLPPTPFLSPACDALVFAQPML